MEKVEHASTAQSQTDFEFKMEAKKRLALIDQARTLSIGDKLIKAKATLGSPDVDHEIVTKEGAVHGRLVYYYLTREHKVTVNEEKDEYIVVDINTQDSVEDVVLKEGGRNKSLLGNARWP